MMTMKMNDLLEMGSGPGLCLVYAFDLWLAFKQ